MKRNAFKHTICGIALALMIPLMVALFAATAWGMEGHRAFELLKVGNPANGTPDLNISTHRPASPGFMPGDRLTVQLTARKPLYVLAINVTSRGTVTILFPNRTRPDSRLEPGKQYSLFPGDSGLSLVLGDLADGGGTVFYTSSEPVDLSALKLPAKGTCITFSETSREPLSIVRKALAALAGTRGFSRIDLPLKDDQGNRYDVEVILTDGTQVTTSEADLSTRGAVQKSLPTGLKSDRPEAITGAAGHSTTVKDELGTSRK